MPLLIKQIDCGPSLLEVKLVPSTVKASESKLEEMPWPYI